MTERERLIELLRNQNCHSPMLCDKNCKYAHLERCYEDRTADWLLANGVIVPPCKVGDTVYLVCKKKYDVDGYGMQWYEDWGIVTLAFRLDMIGNIGKTVFLTESQAEEALKNEQEKL